MIGDITAYIYEDTDFTINVLYFSSNWIPNLSSGFGQTSFGLFDFGN